MASVTPQESGRRGAAASLRSRQLERREGSDFARAWRIRNRPIFDAMEAAGVFAPAIPPRQWHIANRAYFDMLEAQGCYAPAAKRRAH